MSNLGVRAKEYLEEANKEKHYRKVSRSGINWNGDLRCSDKLKQFNNCVVEVRRGKHGIEIFYADAFVCYIETISTSLRGLD